MTVLILDVRLIWSKCARLRAHAGSAVIASPAAAATGDPKARFAVTVVYRRDAFATCAKVSWTSPPPAEADILASIHASFHRLTVPKALNKLRRIGRGWSGKSSINSPERRQNGSRSPFCFFPSEHAFSISKLAPSTDRPGAIVDVQWARPAGKSGSAQVVGGCIRDLAA
jgi:hypothetical protein